MFQDFFQELTPYKEASIPQPSYSLNAGLKSETRTLQAFGTVALLIVIKWYLSSNNIL